MEGLEPVADDEEAETEAVVKEREAAMLQTIQAEEAKQEEGALFYEWEELDWGHLHSLEGHLPLWAPPDAEAESAYLPPLDDCALPALLPLPSDSRQRTHSTNPLPRTKSVSSTKSVASTKSAAINKSVSTSTSRSASSSAPLPLPEAEAVRPKRRRREVEELKDEDLSDSRKNKTLKKDKKDKKKKKAKKEAAVAPEVGKKEGEKEKQKVKKAKLKSDERRKKVKRTSESGLWTPHDDHLLRAAAQRWGPGVPGELLSVILSTGTSPGTNVTNVTNVTNAGGFTPRPAYFPWLPRRSAAACKSRLEDLLKHPLPPTPSTPTVPTTPTTPTIPTTPTTPTVSSSSAPLRLPLGEFLRKALQKKKPLPGRVGSAVHSEAHVTVHASHSQAAASVGISTPKATRSPLDISSAKLQRLVAAREQALPSGPMKLQHLEAKLGPFGKVQPPVTPPPPRPAGVGTKALLSYGKDSEPPRSPPMKSLTSLSGPSGPSTLSSLSTPLTASRVSHLSHVIPRPSTPSSPANPSAPSNPPNPTNPSIPPGNSGPMEKGKGGKRPKPKSSAPPPYGPGLALQLQHLSHLGLQGMGTMGTMGNMATMGTMGNMGSMGTMGSMPLHPSMQMQNPHLPPKRKGVSGGKGVGRGSEYSHPSQVLYSLPPSLPPSLNQLNTPPPRTIPMQMPLNNMNSLNMNMSNLSGVPMTSYAHPGGSPGASPSQPSSTPLSTLLALYSITQLPTSTPQIQEIIRRKETPEGQKVEDLKKVIQEYSKRPPPF